MRLSKRHTPKSILVTGGTGYVGSVFVDYYAKLHPNDRVVIVARSPKPRLRFPSNVLFVLADYGDRQKIEQVLRRYKIDAVVHIAAELDDSAAASNVYKSKSLFEAMDTAGVAQIIYSSTFMVYPYPQEDPTGKLYEHSNVRPASTANYPESKRAVEQLLLDRNTCRTAILRFAIVIGGSDDLAFGDKRPKQGIVPLYANAARESSTIIMPDNGTAARDFIDVQDVASAIERSLAWVAQQQEPSSIVLNVGSGRTHTINDIIAALERASGMAIKAIRGPNPPSIKRSLLDTTHIKKVLHWAPKIEFEESIRNAWQFTKQI